MKRLASLLTLSLWFATGSLARAEWFYDFNDEVIPETFTTEGYLEDWPQPSGTFSASAEGGFLTLGDTAGLPPGSGGAHSAAAFDPEVFPGDVRVSAEINSTGDSDDWAGVYARSSADGDYSAAVAFNGNWSDSGILHVWKTSPLVELGDLIAYRSVSRVTDFSRSYFLDLEVVDDPTTGWAEITSRLYEEEGGTQLLEVSLTDANIYGLPPHTSGVAGVWAWASTPPYSQGALDVTFDNIRAVPEPSTLLLLSVGAAALLAFAGRRKKRAA